MNSGVRLRYRTRLWFALLVAANIAAFALGAKMWQHSRDWRVAMFGIAMYAGALHADADIHEGKARLYQLDPEGRREPTGGTTDGFEIWYWPCFPSLGAPDRYAQEVLVKSYNSVMKKRGIPRRAHVGQTNAPSGALLSN